MEAGFVDAAKFLNRQFILKKDDVPYSTQLISLAALYTELGHGLEPVDSQKLLERWYWSGIFSEAYSGATESQFALDLIEVSEYIRKGTEPRLITESSFVPERLISLRTRNSAAYKGLYALQMKRGAPDWRTDNPLTLASWHDENIDIHHIYPVAWCKNVQIKPSLYNSIINKTPISAKTNRIIGGQSPSRYLSKLGSSNSDLDGTLRAHWLDPNLLRADNFPESFITRGQAMFDLINDTMGKQSVDVRETFRKTLDAGGVNVDLFDDEGEDYEAIVEVAAAEPSID